MAPPHKSVAELGTVGEHGNGWRARVTLDRQNRYGPQRATCAEAQADLDAARQCTSREEMSKFLTSGAQSMKRPRQMDPSSGPPRKSVAELGTVAEHGNGWRVRVKLDGQYRCCLLYTSPSPRD